MLQKRKAVGGLISLIGIIIVFGITSVAYIELSSSQTNLINSSLNANQKISDRNNERLNFTSILSGGSTYSTTVYNLGSDTITIHSQITERANAVFGKEEINKKIHAGSSELITVNLDGTPLSTDKTMFITNLGKKCLVPIVDGSFRVC